MANKPEYVRIHRQRKKEAQEKGIEKLVMWLPVETITRVAALAGFHELKQEEVITKAITAMWQERHDFFPPPTPKPRPRPIKVADDPPQADPPEKKGGRKEKPSKPDKVIEPSPFAAVMPSINLSAKEYEVAIKEYAEALKKKPTVIEGKAERIIEPPKGDPAEPEEAEYDSPFRRSS